jgi:acetyl-CoA synthetase
MQEVEECSASLRTVGLGKGDAIGIHLPMVPETVIALLSIGRIGAIAVPVFSGYGVEAIVSRFNAVNVKGAFTSIGFPRRGKFFNAAEVIDGVLPRVRGLRRLFTIHRDRKWDWIDYWNEGDVDVNQQGRVEPTSAEDPLIILYTSGTTGRPKGIAHTHASFPIKAAQDMALGTDVGRGTRICWYTDIGWMMGPWLIYGALINGATICIYDGAPDYPTPDRMWEFCAKHKVEALGISPTLVRGLAAQEATGARASRLHEHEVRTGAETSEPNGIPPQGGDASGTLALQPPYHRHDLSSLRILASTGEPWNPGPWWWLFEKVGNSKIPIINYSGGTEIAGGILMGNPLLPIKPCSFSAPCPGMDVDIFDENGAPVKPGEVGELVIKQPWIGMARGFWHEKERYLETYWNRFPGIWVHGDWATRDDEGFWYILGRSDDTLKVAGKRVGPAEVESILVSHPLVAEAAVIGVPDETKGTAMVAFCVLRSADTLVRTDAASAFASPSLDNEAAENRSLADKSVRAPLEAELRSLVARDMGKPLAPSRIHFLSALPKTRNAKVMRRVLRSAYLGEDPGDLSALENPQAVNGIRELGK